MGANVSKTNIVCFLFSRALLAMLFRRSTKHDGVHELNVVYFSLNGAIQKRPEQDVANISLVERKVVLVFYVETDSITYSTK